MRRTGRTEARVIDLVSALESSLESVGAGELTSLTRRHSRIVRRHGLDEHRRAANRVDVGRGVGHTLDELEELCRVDIE